VIYGIWIGYMGRIHTWDGQLALSLQEGRVGLDELLRLHTPNRISIIPSAEVLTTPSRLLCCICSPWWEIESRWWRCVGGWTLGSGALAVPRLREAGRQYSHQHRGRKLLQPWLWLWGVRNVVVKWQSWREGKQFTASGSGNLETREFDFGGNFSVGS
jgi:hypothetical protein